MNNKNHNGMVMPIISGVLALGITLVLGAYGYTWSEMKNEQNEKHQWRSEHQQVLDKKFKEVKEGQQKIEELVRRKEEDTSMILKEILDEQRKANEGSKKRSR